MAAETQHPITLGADVVQAVRARFAAGGYASESEVIREGLRALDERERTLEDWLRGPVADEYAAWEAGTLITVDLSEVRREFGAEQ